MESRRHQQRAFGLLEVVISSGILALVLGAATGLIRASLRRTVLAADRSVAMNLAQEPIEQLRSARDSTFIDGNPATNWSTYLPDSRCDVVLHASSGQNCISYKINPPIGTDAWSVVPGIESPISLNGQDYTREIYINTPGPSSLPPEPSFIANTGIAGAGTTILDTDVVRRIHVIVRWDNNTQAVEAASYLTNWRSGS